MVLMNAVEGWISKSRYLKQVDDYSAANGFNARLLPLAPSGIITAIAAVSRLSFKDFRLLSKCSSVMILFLQTKIWQN